MINYLSDTHVHTHYSPDADQDATFSAYIKQAKKLGLKQIVFTDHVDFDAAHPLFKDTINFDEYTKDFIESTKDETDIDVQLGVEIGYQRHVKVDIIEFLKKYPFQHVIMSIHYIEKKDLYTKEYFLNKTKEEAFSIYFEKVLEAIKTIDDFTVIGHLDYIPRYSDFGDYDYQVYKDVIDEILLELIKKNKGIEINTSGYNYEKRQYPKKEVIERFIELGGRKMTLGSDAHKVSDLKRYYEQLKQTLKKEQR
mgnify:CR=1 FL=1